MNEAEEFYTEERLLAQMSRAELDGVETMGKAIIGDVERFAGAKKQTDDMCLTVFGRVHGS
jgi:serine phosphatase RsbU (regulator of sigma subunit)